LRKAQAAADLQVAFHGHLPDQLSDLRLIHHLTGSMEHAERTSPTTRRIGLNDNDGQQWSDPFVQRIASVFKVFLSPD
jgi:hypothetical protein